MFHGQHSYELGTEIQDKSGRVKKKIGDSEGAKWMGRNRYNWMQHHKRELEDGEKVFHMNGDKADDTPGNLVAIKFIGIKYNLKRSRVVYAPKKSLNIKPWLPKRKELAVA